MGDEAEAVVVEEVPVPKPRTESLRAVFERNTTTAADGIGKRKSLPRATVEITVDCTICAPGVFGEDFEIKLRATTAIQEQTIARGFKGDPTGYQGALARASMYQFNGVDIGTGEDEWLWDALGPAGRNLVLVGWQQLVMPHEQAMGKAKGSLKIGG